MTIWIRDATAAERRAVERFFRAKGGTVREGFPRQLTERDGPRGDLYPGDLLIEIGVKDLVGDSE